MNLRLITSGATNPGVPHLVYIYGLFLTNVAKPKSAITTESKFLYKLLNISYSYSLNNMFSNFKSLCIIPFLCICLIPLTKPYIIENILF